MQQDSNGIVVGIVADLDDPDGSAGSGCATRTWTTS